MVWPAFEIADIGAGSADDGGDFGEKAGAIFRLDGKLYRERGGAFSAPLDCDAAFGLVEKILDVGAGFCVHRHAAAASDVAGDVVSGDGVAALRAEEQT